MNSNLLLKKWNLPKSVEEQYSKNGLTSMFQWQADCLSIEGVLGGRNLVFAAPTSAGKTFVAEILMLKRVLETGKKALLILPFVSVAREKLFYMRDLFEETGVRVDGYMGGHAPTNGFSSVDIAVCTIEKANGLINRLIEEKKIDQIGMLVVDELHMVGDEGRGYILELLLTKIRFMSSRPESPSQGLCNIQIVGMSATLPNLGLLADWLDAALYVTDFRPVPLVRYLKVGNSIYDEKLKKIRDFLPAFDCKNDDDNLPALCYETLKEGHSVLVFCPTKSWCEKLANNIARQFYNLNCEHEKDKSSPFVKLDLKSLKEIFEQLVCSPVGVDAILNRTLPLGVAYHHAGLTTEERDIVEAGFRVGAIRVLVATSTLSSGVNLPARRVIIRTPMFNRKVIDVRTYLQMTGRAGRKGVDEKGESILVCRPTEQSRGKSLLTAKPLPIKSCLFNSVAEELTTSMKRAILEIIVNGIAETYDSVMAYTNCTLLSAQLRTEAKKVIKGPVTRRRSSSLSPVRRQNQGFSKDVIHSCINWLIEHEFVFLQEKGNRISNELNNLDNKRIVATQLGRAALLSSLPTADALSVLADLHQAMKALALDTDLHLIYLVTPIFCYNDWTGLDWYQYLNVYEALSNSQKNAANLIGVDGQFLVSMASGASIPKRGKQAEKMERLLGTHRRFYAALALHDLVQEISLSKVCEKFSCNRGMLQQLQQSAGSFAGMVTTFCQELGWWSLEVLLREFQTRLEFGVQRELMDLMQVSFLNCQRARALYAAGITSCTLLHKSTASQIELILRNSSHFQTERKAVNESEWEAEERKKQRIIHITGHRGLTEHEAAAMIVQEAARICGATGKLSSTLNGQEGQDSLCSTHVSSPSHGQTTTVSQTDRSITTSSLTSKNLVSHTKNSAELATDSGFAAGNEDNCSETKTTVIPTATNDVSCSNLKTNDQKPVLPLSLTESQLRMVVDGDPMKDLSINQSESQDILDKKLPQVLEKTASDKSKSLNISTESELDNLINEVSESQIYGQGFTINDHKQANAPESGKYDVNGQSMMPLETISNDKLHLEPSEDMFQDVLSSSTEGNSDCLKMGSLSIVSDSSSFSDSSSPEPVTLFLSSPSEKCDDDSSINDSAVSDSPIKLNLQGESSNEMEKESDKKSEIATSKLKNTSPEDTSVNEGKKSHDTLKISLTDSQLCAVFDEGNFSEMDDASKLDLTKNAATPLGQCNSKTIANGDKKEEQRNLNYCELSPGVLAEMNISFSPCPRVTAYPSIKGVISDDVKPKTTNGVNVVSYSTPKLGKSSCHVSSYDKSVVANFKRIASPCGDYSLNEKNFKTVSKENRSGSIAVESHLSRVTPKDDSGNLMVSDESLEDLFECPPVQKKPRELAVTCSKSSKLSTLPYRTFNIFSIPDTQNSQFFEVSPEIDEKHSLTGRKRKFPNSLSPATSEKVGKIMKTPSPTGKNIVPLDVDNLILSSQKDKHQKKSDRASSNVSSKAKTAIVSGEKQRNKHMTNPSKTKNYELFQKDSHSPCTDLTNKHVNKGVTESYDSGLTSAADNSSRITRSNMALNIVDVCSHSDVFDSFMKEWSSQNRFSIAVATKYQQQKVSKEKVGSKKIGSGEYQCSKSHSIHIIGIAVCWNPQDVYYMSLDKEEGEAGGSTSFHIDKRLNKLRSSASPFLKKNSTVIACDIKTQMKVLRKVTSPKIQFWLDPMVAAWLLNPSADSKALFELVNQFLPEDTHLLKGLDKCDNFGSIACKPRNERFAPARIRACAEAICSYRVMAILKSNLKDIKLWRVFSDLEMPHIRSISFMEINGIGFDKDACDSEITKLHEITKTLENTAYALAKKRFNLGSPSEVAKILFHDLGLPPAGSVEDSTAAVIIKPGIWRRGAKNAKKGSWSTKKEVLEKLKSLHPLPEIILNWRQVTFSLSKTLHPFNRSAVLSKDLGMHRIHAECLTHSVTGRISVAEPNIQNVAKSFKEKKSHEICLRNLFIPAEGYMFLAADYSQLEIRIFAHMSGDDKLLEILNSPSGDVFKMIAANWRGTSVDSVTSDERQRAKQICYGMLYGIGAKALSQQLSIDERSAEEFMESFLRSFPAMRAYIRTLVKKCKEKGYVETLIGRRRYLPAINDLNMSVRSQAERQAVNTTVQGSAADVIKNATIDIHKVMKKKWKILVSEGGREGGLTTKSTPSHGCYLVLHMHDELIFEVHKDIVHEAASIVQSCMENSIQLKVKLPVKISVGSTWGKLQEFKNKA